MNAQKKKQQKTTVKGLLLRGFADIEDEENGEDPFSALSSFLNCVRDTTKEIGEKGTSVSDTEALLKMIKDKKSETMDRLEPEWGTLKCLVCDAEFISPKILRFHELTHLEGTMYLCKICGYGFKSQKIFDEHILLHSKEAKEDNALKCRLCQTSFEESDQLKEHEKTCKEAKSCPACLKPSCWNPDDMEFKYECCICKQVLKTESAYRAHRKKMHDGICFKCYRCSKICFTTEEYNNHIRVHNPDHHECSECGNRYSSAAALKAHHSEVHKKGEECEECGKIFRTKQSRRRHFIAKHSQHKCQICEGVFSSEKALKSHEATVHKGKKGAATDDPYDCLECGALFKTNSALKIHADKKHKGEGVKLGLECMYCDKKVKDQQALNLHISTKHAYMLEKSTEGTSPKKKMASKKEEPVHKCATCKAFFKSQRQLDDHICTPLSDKPFSCFLCSRTFRSPAELQKHEKKCNKKRKREDSPVQTEETFDKNKYRSGSNEFKCPSCDSCFRKPEALREHLASHNEETLSECRVCSKKFMSKFLLKRHEESHPELQSLSKKKMKPTSTKPIQRFTCEQCRKLFDTEEELSSHACEISTVSLGDIRLPDFM